jgi:hypothetical protein
MTSILKTVDFSATLASEWQRVELLCRCMQQSNKGLEIEAETLQHLSSKQQQVLALRETHSDWLHLPVSGLSVLEMDVLAIVLALEAEPRLAMLYQALQPGMTSPYPTLPFIQELLAVNHLEVPALYRAIQSDSALVTRKLIEVDQTAPFFQIKPVAGVVASLQGWKPGNLTPPGAMQVAINTDWDDLVLPADRLKMLHEYLLWIKQRHIVFDQWEGCPIGGPIALFAGPSGTGKTFAATVLANDLGWSLYRVDLGKLVSKYVGETEKNLNQVFDAAHNKPIILQFDEADSLISKRGEIREARDRYANLEVNYLLARIESHNGPCILTTNLRGQIDTAFYRRFQMVVEFPRPDAAARGKLWERLMPKKAPIGKDVDFIQLGSWVNLTGGAIRNAALHACFLAADEMTCVQWPHIAMAVWRELTKDGQSVSKAEMGPLWTYLSKAVLDAHA